jgi:hypothetical protein
LLFGSAVPLGKSFSGERRDKDKIGPSGLPVGITAPKRQINLKKFRGVRLLLHIVFALLAAER